MVASKNKTHELDDEQLRVLARITQQGMSLREALIEEGYNRSNISRTEKSWQKDQRFNEAIASSIRDSLQLEAPRLLQHAVKLAYTSRSDFVQAEMTKWLLERAGLQQEKLSYKDSNSLRVGSLTLNILPSAGIPGEGGGVEKGQVLGVEVTHPQLPPSRSSSEVLELLPDLIPEVVEVEDAD